MQVDIYKNEKVLASGLFDTKEQMDKWVGELRSEGELGKEAYSYEREVTPAILDGEGNISTPAVTETVEVPAEYEIDITSTERNEQWVQKRKAAKAKLKAVDYTKLTTVASVKNILKEVIEILDL